MAFSHMYWPPWLCSSNLCKMIHDFGVKIGHLGGLDVHTQPQKTGPQLQGLRGPNQKIHWVILWCLKMMLLQRGKHPILHIAVFYLYTPQRGRVHGVCAAFDPQTLFKVTPCANHKWCASATAKCLVHMRLGYAGSGGRFFK